MSISSQKYCINDLFRNIPLKDINNYECYPYSIDDKGLIWLHLAKKNLTGLYTLDPKSLKLSLISKTSSTNFSLLPKQEFKPIKTYYTASTNDIGFSKVSFKDNKEVNVEHFFDGRNGLPALNHIGDYVYVENDSTIWISGENETGLLKFNPFTKNAPLGIDYNQFLSMVGTKDFCFQLFAGGVLHSHLDKDTFQIQERCFPK